MGFLRGLNPYLTHLTQQQPLRFPPGGLFLQTIELGCRESERGNFQIHSHYPARAMPWAILSFETTPNPDALIAHLDAAVSNGPRSFLDPFDSEGDPLAASLFGCCDLRCLLFNGDRLTINKAPSADWSEVRRAVRQVLAEA